MQGTQLAVSQNDVSFAAFVQSNPELDLDDAVEWVKEQEDYQQLPPTSMTIQHDVKAAGIQAPTLIHQNQAQPRVANDFRSAYVSGTTMETQANGPLPNLRTSFAVQEGWTNCREHETYCNETTACSRHLFAEIDFSNVDDLMYDS